MGNSSSELSITERAGRMLIAILGALEKERAEVRERVMMACGKECANLPCPPNWRVSLNTVRQIARQTRSTEERINLLNQKVPWCGNWTLQNDAITSECTECGCLLVQANLVSHDRVWCDCSLGWVKTIFEVLLQSQVDVELVSAIGRGEATCQYKVRLAPKSIYA